MAYKTPIKTWLKTNGTQVDWVYSYLRKRGVKLESARTKPMENWSHPTPPPNREPTIKEMYACLLPQLEQLEARTTDGKEKIRTMKLAWNAKVSRSQAGTKTYTFIMSKEAGEKLKKIKGASSANKTLESLIINTAGFRSTLERQFKQDTAENRIKYEAQLQGKNKHFQKIYYFPYENYLDQKEQLANTTKKLKETESQLETMRLQLMESHIRLERNNLSPDPAEETRKVSKSIRKEALQRLEKLTAAPTDAEHKGR